MVNGESICRDAGDGVLKVEQCSQYTQTSDVALKGPTTFHCIPLFLFSTWGLPHWSMPAEGALHSDQALWESSRAFKVDLLRVGLSRASGQRLYRRKSGRGNDDVYSVSNVRLFCFFFNLGRKTQKTKMFIYMIVIISIGIFY